MTYAEAANVAWHIRTNGLTDAVKHEDITEAFAAFEAEVARYRSSEMILIADRANLQREKADLAAQLADLDR